ncbi:helix-turn-helix transcriptional regulator [Pseudoflavonifractor sp. 524-17]|uniref:helix-turn-helix domain-containing protein n=1 Tax=Pseudoflavonifractor sp. 524-17 TaxID=2304577 RepID=UPI00137B51CB|nr:helix-turn-helix transcriptional regulator [Pseudoflavonifractor sp. 524-17]
MDYTALGVAIRKKRNERGWKIAVLADKVGVSEDFIGKIERATDIPSLQTIVAIANALEVSIDSLLRDDLAVIDVSLCEELNCLLENMNPKRKKLFLQFVRNNVDFFNKVDFEVDS